MCLDDVVIASSIDTRDSAIIGQLCSLLHMRNVRFSDSDGVDRPYLTTIDEHEILLEVPLTDPEQDCLHFDDYASMIAEHILAPAALPVGVGIFAKWGAGKV